MSDAATLAQKRKLSESSEAVNVCPKKAATQESIDDDDCQILEKTIPLVIVDSDLEDLPPPAAAAAAAADDVVIVETVDLDSWIWVNHCDVAEAKSSRSGDKTETTNIRESSPVVAAVEPIPAGTVDAVNEISTEPIITLTFRDKSTFNALKNMLHQAIRDTLFRHQRVVQIDESADKLQLIIADSTDDDSCVFMVDALPAAASSSNQSSSIKTPNKAGDVPQYSLNVSKVLDHSTPTVPSAVANTENNCQRPAKNQCFNCNGNHTMRECPEPKNQQMIQMNRNKFVPYKTERYHVDASQQFGHFAAGVVSQALRAALGLRDQELPLHVYRMRMLGYPPGWLEDAVVTQSGMELFDDREKADAAAEENGQVTYDLKKIISYPGFNVDPEPGVYDMSYNLRMPQMSPHQSREEMIKSLRGQSARRTKSKFDAPVANLKARPVDLSAQEMDIEDGEEPSTPPPPGITHPPHIPDTSPASPSLDELRRQQDCLLAALDASCTTVADDSIVSTSVDDSLIDDILALDTTADLTVATSVCDSPEPNNVDTPSTTTALAEPSTPTTVAPRAAPHEFATPATPLNSSIHTVSGTPLIRSVSPYETIPVGAAWSVGVSDIIDFENLSGSVGKYEKMKGLIKKVRVAIKDLNDEYQQ